MSDIRFNQWLHNSGTGGVSQVDGGHVGIGTTNPLIPVGAGVTAILNVGVVTANSYYGDGSNLSGIVGGGTSLSFNDNIGAYFGNSQDLKIYHDGNHSYIDDQGTGNLRLRSGTLEILNLAGNKTSATFSSGGGQTLNFNNSAKFVTTNTGIDVTGSVVADDLIVTGTSVVGDFKSTNNNYVLGIAGNNASDKAYVGTDSSGNFLIATGSGVDERLRIRADGKVGINQGSGIQTRLHVSENIADSASLSWANSTMTLSSVVGGNSTANRSTLYFAPYNAANQYCPSAISVTAETNYQSTLKFFTNVAGNGTGHLTSYERLRIASDGKVRIGSGTPQLALLHISPTLYGINLQNDSNNKSRILFSKNSAGNDSRAWIEGNGELSGYIILAAGDDERLRITADGNAVFKEKDGGHTGGGIYSRTKTCTTSGTNVFQFSLAHGALAGTLYAIGSNNANSVSKVYAFAGHHGSNDLQPIADSGSYGGNNFTVSCSTSGSTHTFSCTTTGGNNVQICFTFHLGSPNQDITYTKL